MNQHWIKPIAAIACCIAIGGLSGCNFQFSNGYMFTFTGTKVDKSDGDTISSSVKSINVENQFGNVKIEETTGEAKWEWSASVWGDDEEAALLFLDSLVMEVTTDGENQTWTLIMPEKDSALNGVKSDLTIFAPAKCEVITKNSHGDSDISKLTGSSKIENRHGDTRISDNKADTSIVNRHGEVKMSRIEGKITIDNTHGDVKVAYGMGDIDCKNTHGRLEISADSENVKCSSTHGDVEFDLTSDKFESVEISTTHADITLWLPSSAEPDVKMKTSHGDMSSDFQSNSGGPEVILKTTHGDIDVNQK